MEKLVPFRGRLETWKSYINKLRSQEESDLEIAQNPDRKEENEQELHRPNK